MLQYSICAFLAPALASAAAFPWALPEPTFAHEADNWSPAPTLAPGLGAMELFKRAAGGLNTCGYISAKSSSSLTCNNSDYVCVTNPGNGVHGCCDPSSIAECKIATTCIASTDMSKSCTDSACSNNDYIAKCTQSAYPFCYEWRYVFSTQTVMTEHGCASAAWTISVQFTYSDGEGNSPLPTRVVQTSEASTPISTDASDSTDGSVTQSFTAPPASSTTAGGSVVAPVSKSKTNIGAIVGGVVGGVAVLGALAFAIIFLILRNKKAKQEAAHNTATGVNQPMMGPGPGVTEYKPQDPYGSPAPQYPPTPGQQYAAPYSPAPGVAGAAGYYGHEQKAMFPHQGVPGAPGSPPPPPGVAPFGAPGPVAPVEAGGTPIQPPAETSKPAQVYEAP